MHRPKQVAWWIARHRRYSLVPAIENVGAYGRDWTLWWNALQPEWRQNVGREGGLPREEYQPSNDWACLQRSGRNGLLMVMIALAWWGQAKIGNDWLAAVRDVKRVMQALQKNPLSLVSTS
jgi:hypothetical protein